MPEIDPSLLKRKIIHFDMDAFYASIEVRDRPELKGKPVVVGGSPQSRAVVCTASYEARKFGVRSAIPCSQAARLCPQAVFLTPNFAKYKAASQQIHQIFQRYTSMIEPLSLDEAYLDVTDNSLGLYAVQIAKLIQKEIFAETGLTGSAGVAPNKLLAKIASDLRKPAGISVILPDQVQDFMAKLPLRKIHGIGPRSEERLRKHGLVLCQDVWNYEASSLESMLGSSMAAWLYDRVRGIDTRAVQNSRKRKSLGQEETFASDILDLDRLSNELAILSGKVSEGLQRKALKARTITIKVKYADFEQVTRSYSIPYPTDKQDLIFEIALGLLEKTEAGRRPIRLLGVATAKLTSHPPSNLSL